MTYSTARRGKDTEHRTIAWLKAEDPGFRRGWPIIVRSAASKGPYDLIAMDLERSPCFLLINVKRGAWPKASERRLMIEHAQMIASRSFPVRVLAVRWDRYARRPQVLEFSARTSTDPKEVLIEEIDLTD